MRPADDVQSTSAAVTNTAAAASALRFGATGKVGDLTVTVGDVRLNAVITESIGASQRPRASEPGYAWALVHVRVENSTAKEATRPDMMLQCAAGEGRRYAYEGPGALAENPALPARSRQVLSVTKCCIAPRCVVTWCYTKRGATPVTSTTETAATIRFALVRSTPDGETYAARIAPDGTLVSITADLAHDDVEDILEGRANIAEFDFNEPTEGQVEAWERDGWETGPRLVEFETRTTVYETHPDGSPALWLETASDGTRTLIDDGKTPVVLALGEDVDEAVAAWRAAVGDDEAGR